MLVTPLLVRHIGVLCVVSLFNHLVVLDWGVGIVPVVFALMVDWDVLSVLSLMGRLNLMGLHALLDVVRLVDVMMSILELLRSFLISCHFLPLGRCLACSESSNDECDSSHLGFVSVLVTIIM